MKALNNIKFISEATAQFNRWLRGIDEAEDYGKARTCGAAALGYVDCMTVYLNNMVCLDNNGFTEDLGELLDSWAADVYQHLAWKAIDTKAGNDEIMQMLKKRDKYR